MFGIRPSRENGEGMRDQYPLFKPYFNNHGQGLKEWKSGLPRHKKWSTTRLDAGEIGTGKQDLRIGHLTRWFLNKRVQCTYKNGISLPEKTTKGISPRWNGFHSCVYQQIVFKSITAYKQKRKYISVKAYQMDIEEMKMVSSLLFASRSFPAKPGWQNV